MVQDGDYVYLLNSLYLPDKEMQLFPLEVNTV